MLHGMRIPLFICGDGRKTIGIGGGFAVVLTGGFLESMVRGWRSVAACCTAVGPGIGLDEFDQVAFGILYVGEVDSGALSLRGR